MVFASPEPPFVMPGERTAGATKRAAQKEGPARLKGGAKYLGCGEGEGSPNPPQRNPVRGSAVPMTATRKFDCAFPATVPSWRMLEPKRTKSTATCCPKTAAIALSLAHIFVLISFQVLAPLRRGSLFLPDIVARWPAARITLRQAARVLEDSRRLHRV